MARRLSRVMSSVLAVLLAVLCPTGAALGSGEDIGAEVAAGPPSPRGALLRSAIYPGWGQLANGKHFKACVIFAVEGYMAGVVLTSARHAQDAAELSRSASSQEEFTKFEERRARYLDRKNSHIWWLGATILYSMLDAYVDANLAGVSEEASKPPPVFLEPGVGPDVGVRLGLRVRY